MFISLIPYVYNVFINDISVKGPSLCYNKLEIANYSGIYRFVIKHLVNFNRVLFLNKLAGITIVVKKSN